MDVTYKNIFFILFLVLISQSAFANDSTLLERRIAKIKSLAGDLKLLPDFSNSIYSDTSKLFSFYRSVETKYFQPSLSDSIYKNTFGISGFHSISSYPDSLIFRYPDPAKDSITDVSKLTNYLSNTVILYYPMYGSEWELFYFVFKKDSDQLVRIIEAGGEKEEYRFKKQFIDKIVGSEKRG